MLHTFNPPMGSQVAHEGEEPGDRISSPYGGEAQLLVGSYGEKGWRNATNLNIC